MLKSDHYSCLFTKYSVIFVLSFTSTAPRKGLPEVVLCSFEPSNTLSFHSSSPSSSDTQMEPSSSGSSSQLEENKFPSDMKLERRMKVEAKNRAIKVDPVDVSKLGSPRSRRPIIEGDVRRVSDLNLEPCQGKNEKQGTSSSELLLSGDTPNESQQRL